MNATPLTAASPAASIRPSGVRSRRQARAARVVVGVDGSPGAGAALRWAAAEASRRDAALRIVSAWQDDDLAAASRGGPADRSLAAAGRVQDALDGLLHQHGRPRRVACVTPRGLPGRMLVEQAEDAVLLVLGVGHGAGPGATGMYCLRFARCPVVFVRE